MVSASDLGSEGREFEPWPVHPRCVLRQSTYLSQCLSPSRCINGNQKISWGQPAKLLGGNLRWTDIPSRGSRNTPSRFILQKPELMVSPSFDWGQTSPYLYPSPLTVPSPKLINFAKLQIG